jgi:uncharacterized protein
VQFEWDPAKSRANLGKHGVSFEAARLVFDDPRHVSRQVRYEDHEERWQTLGSIGTGAVLLVAHTLEERDGEEIVRIISARKADARERERYARGEQAD